MPGPIQSVARAAAILHVLGATQEPLALGELARMVDLAKPTVHGLVRTLCDVGFVVQDSASGRYRLGAGLSRLGVAPDPHLLRSRSVNWADGLAARTGLEVQLGVRAGASVEIVHHVFRPDGSPQRLRVGELQPVHATALGHTLLAFSPASSRLHELELPAFTPRTTTRHDVLERALHQTQRQGWACVDGGLRLGVAAIAAPLRQLAGVGVGALAVVGPRDRLLSASGDPLPRLTDQVTTAARAISSTLQDRL